MSEPDRIVTRDIYWINAHTSPPPNGMKVRVLNHGGCDAGSATWNDESIKQFDGWLEFAKVPDDIKKIQSARHPIASPDESSKSDKVQISNGTENG